MKFNWAFGCIAGDRSSDGTDAVQHRGDCDVGQMARSMTFRIETAARGRFTVFILSGRIEKQAMGELRRLFELQTDYHDIILDLKNVSLVDRDVMGFLARCETDGVRLENCDPYI